MTTEEFEDWFDGLSILTYGEISDEEIMDSFKTILQWKQEGVFISDKIPDDKFTILEYWLLLSYLETCITYGASPRGAWLTEFGEDVLKYLKGLK